DAPEREPAGRERGEEVGDGRARTEPDGHPVLDQLGGRLRCSPFFLLDAHAWRIMRSPRDGGETTWHESWFTRRPAPRTPRGRRSRCWSREPRSKKGTRCRCSSPATAFISRTRRRRPRRTGSAPAPSPST